MKAQVTLLLGALLTSASGLAASGSADAEVQTDRDQTSGAGGLETGPSQAQFRFDGDKQAAHARISGRMSLHMDELVDAPRESFAKLDRDGDGMISAGESTSSRPVLTQFDRADDNGDRMLSANEFDALVASFEEEMAE